MLVLGIETTCDETAAAVVKDGEEILSNVVSSQIEMHRPFGGVVPELACRRHVDILLPVIQEALEKAGVSLKEINLIAVAKGPGLVGPLMVGINGAKTLSFCLGLPFVGVNHVEAHLYAALMGQQERVLFPALGVILSGGHTSLIKMEAVGSYQVIGQTVDDAIGEAFDKVAKILGLSYPGGPEIEKLAKQGKSDAFSFSAGKVKGRPLDFSFSGLKTAVLYAVKGPRAHMDSPVVVGEEQKADVAASFQEAAFQDVIKKVREAAKQQGCRSLLFGGGVTNSRRLREMMETELPIFWPGEGLSLDNAAMIAGLGYHVFQKTKISDPLDLEAVSEYIRL